MALHTCLEDNLHNKCTNRSHEPCFLLSKAFHNTVGNANRRVYNSYGDDWIHKVGSSRAQPCQNPQVPDYPLPEHRTAGLLGCTLLGLAIGSRSLGLGLTAHALEYHPFHEEPYGSDPEEDIGIRLLE